jgi:hypothetical protein
MSRSTLRIAVVVWTLILTAIMGRVLLAKRCNSVYPIFSSAGSAWIAGKPVYRDSNPDLDVFRYSPPIAVGFAGWSLLPAPVGEVLWRLLNAAVLLGGLVYWSRWWRPDWDCGLMLLLVIPLAVGGLNNGQCNALIAGLLLFAQVWFARERLWSAGVAVAICVLLKEYPLALGLLFAIIEPRRFTPRFAICLIAGLALPYLMRSPEYVTGQYRAWLARIAGDDRTTSDISYSYRDLHMLLRVAGVPLSMIQYRALELALAAVIGAYVWIQRDRWTRQHGTWVCGALASCWMTLAGPATESPTYVLVAPILAACALAAMEGPRLLLIFMSVSNAAFTIAALIVWFPSWVSRPVHASGLHPLAALLLTIVAVHLSRREGATPSENNVLDPEYQAP